MRMLTVNCGQNSVLGAFHFEFSEGGKWGRVRYQCCKAGGAPVTFDPRGQAPGGAKRLGAPSPSFVERC